MATGTEEFRKDPVRTEVRSEVRNEVRSEVRNEVRNEGSSRAGQRRRLQTDPVTGMTKPADEGSKPDTKSGMDPLGSRGMETGMGMDPMGSDPSLWGQMCAWQIAPQPPPEGFKLLVSYSGSGMGTTDTFRIFDGSLPDAVKSTVDAYDFYDGRTPRQMAQHGLVPKSSSKGVATAEVLPASGKAFAVFDTSSSTLPSFSLTWRLQALTPPDQPEAPRWHQASTTVNSLAVMWQRPRSTLPVTHYRLKYSTGGQTVGYKEFPYTTRRHTLLDLAMGTSYLIRVQAWTEAIDVSACDNGANYRCSLWSDVANVTTSGELISWCGSRPPAARQLRSTAAACALLRPLATVGHMHARHACSLLGRHACSLRAALGAQTPHPHPLSRCTRPTRTRYRHDAPMRKAR